MPVLSERALLVANALVSSPAGFRRMELRAATGLSGPTIQRALADLRAAGWLEEKASEQSPVGAHVRLGREAGVIAAVDVGRRHVRSQLADVHGRPLHDEPVEAGAIDVDEEGMAVLATVRQTLLTALQRASEAQGEPYTLSEIRCVAVGVPAPVQSTGSIADLSLSEWSGKPVRHLIHRALAAHAETTGETLHPHLEIVVAKDAEVGALATWREYHDQTSSNDGGSRGTKDRDTSERASGLLFVKASHGIDAAFIHRGELVSGHRGMAAQLGHMWVPAQFDEFLEDFPVRLREAPPTKCLRCGRRACLENMASGAAQLRLLERVRESGAPQTLREMVAQINDDPAAHALSRQALIIASIRLGVVIAEASRVLDPSHIKVGGILASAGDTLMAPLRTAFARSTIGGQQAEITAVGSHRIDRVELDGAIELARRTLDFARDRVGVTAPAHARDD